MGCPKHLLYWTRNLSLLSSFQVLVMFDLPISHIWSMMSGVSFIGGALIATKDGQSAKTLKGMEHIKARWCSSILIVKVIH